MIHLKVRASVIFPQVIATETLGQQSRRGYAQVVVSVINENDNAPVFSQDVYTNSIPENNVAGTFVIQVSTQLITG